jgi:hypothetical protein
VSVRFRDSNRSDGYFSQSCSIFVSLSLPVSSCYSVLLTWPYVIDTPVFIYYLSKKYDRLLCLSLVVYLFVWNVFCPIFPPTTSHPEKRKKTFATQRLRNSRVTACRPSPLKSYRISARLKGYVSFLFQMMSGLLVPGTGSKIFLMQLELFSLLPAYLFYDTALRIFNVEARAAVKAVSIFELSNSGRGWCIFLNLFI